MGPAEIHDILQWGGSTSLLIIVLIGAIVALWRHNMKQLGSWAATQTEETKTAVQVSERSTVAILQLTEFIKTSAAAGLTYQQEMRIKVDTALNELRAFKAEMENRLPVRRR